ncbi:hypothetical protein Hanom_Chr08g00744531 [Helianthus anomalus]
MLFNIGAFPFRSTPNMFFLRLKCIWINTFFISSNTKTFRQRNMGNMTYRNIIATKIKLLQITVRDKIPELL